MPEFNKVGVVGYGAMGGGIAQVIAQAGISVIALDVDQMRLEHGEQAIRAFLDEGVQREKITAEERDRALARISATTSVDDLADCDLIIEAVSEREDVKSALFKEIGATVSDTSVVVTNTSALSVSALAIAIGSPERFAGLHFFNPAQLMRVVEVVRAEQTDITVIERLVAFVKELGKDPVVVKDRPGFLVNHLLMPYLNDVIREFDNELASAEDLDVAIKLGLGYKQGPMELLDRIGLDVHLDATRAAYASTCDPAFVAPPLLQTMVATNRLGRKAGSGFRTEGK